MSIKNLGVKYGITVAIAFGAIWAANNVPMVKKAVGPKSA